LAKCAFIKPGGDRCGARAMKGYETCYGHRPDLAEERKRNASRGGKRGGRGRSSRVRSSRGEITEIKDLLKDLTERVLAGDLLPGPAIVVNQLQNTRLRAVEQARKNRETEDLEARIEALERGQGAQAKPAGSVWRGAHSGNRKGG